MKFCALTKKEVEAFSSILNQEGIEHEITVDSDVVDANEESIKFNLRHLNAPSISTSVLSLEVEDQFWDQLSKPSTVKLSELGFSQLEVNEVIILSAEGETEPLRSVLNTGSKRLIGIHFLLYFAVIGAITFLIRYFAD